VALSNKDLGYLPGGVDEKVGPYMQPLYDNKWFLFLTGKEKDREEKHQGDILHETGYC
jgi:PhoH-like ATPase